MYPKINIDNPYHYLDTMDPVCDVTNCGNQDSERRTDGTDVLSVQTANIELHVSQQAEIETPESGDTAMKDGLNKACQDNDTLNSEMSDNIKEQNDTLNSCTVNSVKVTDAMLIAVKLDPKSIDQTSGTQSVMSVSETLFAQDQVIEISAVEERQFKKQKLCCEVNIVDQAVSGTQDLEEGKPSGSDDHTQGNMEFHASNG